MSVAWLRDGIGLSSPDAATHFGQHLITVDRVDLAGPNLIAPSCSLSGPKTLKLGRFSNIEALDKPVDEDGPVPYSKLHRFGGHLIDAAAHSNILRLGLASLKLGSVGRLSLTGSLTVAALIGR